MKTAIGITRVTIAMAVIFAFPFIIIFVMAAIVPINGATISSERKSMLLNCCS